MLLDIQGDMEALKNTKKQMEKLQTEGRKEGYELGKNNELKSQCGKKNYDRYIAKLEKENKISEEIIIGEQQKINRLEKENAELKQKLESDELALNEANEIIAELKAHNENKREEINMLRNEHKQDMLIHNNYVNKVEELKAQIEKMKCCGNCFKWNTNKRCGDRYGAEVCDNWGKME